jgi:hypothetical protein
LPQDTTPADLPVRVRRVLRKEFTDFFVNMRTAEPGWPAIPDQAFVDALADSLVEMAKRTGKQPVAYLQTLAIELQDRINDQLKG